MTEEQENPLLEDIELAIGIMKAGGTKTANKQYSTKCANKSNQYGVTMMARQFANVLKQVMVTAVAGLKQNYTFYWDIVGTFCMF